MIVTLVIAIQKPIIMLDLWVRVITLNNNKYQEQRQASEKKINEGGTGVYQMMKRKKL